MPPADASPRTSGLKIAAFTLLPSVFLAASDLAVRYWYRQPLWRLAFNVLSNHSSDPESTVFRKPLARFDPVVGYSCIPGVHVVSLTKGWARIDFRVAIGDDGYRVTSRASDSQKKPDLWILGCSYTWGLGVNDEETFPWIVQSSMRELRVRNLGGNGYGNLQALLQMRDAVEHQRQLPRIAVLVYNDFDPARNTAAPSFLHMMNAIGDSTIRSPSRLGSGWFARPQRRSASRMDTPVPTPASGSFGT